MLTFTSALPLLLLLLLAPPSSSLNPLHCPTDPSSTTNSTTFLTPTTTCPATPSTLNACYYNASSFALTPSSAVLHTAETTASSTHLTLVIDALDALYNVSIASSDASCELLDKWQLVSRQRHVEDLSACYSTYVLRVPWDEVTRCAWRQLDDPWGGVDKRFQLDLVVHVQVDRFQGAEHLVSVGEHMLKTIEATFPSGIEAKPSALLVDAPLNDVRVDVSSATIVAPLAVGDSTALSVQIITSTPAPYRLFAFTTAGHPETTGLATPLSGQQDDLARLDPECTDDTAACRNTWLVVYSSTSRVSALCSYGAFDGQYSVTFRVACTNGTACDAPDDTVTFSFTLSTADSCAATFSDVCSGDDCLTYVDQLPQNGFNPLRCAYDEAHERFFYSSGFSCPNIPTELNSCHADIDQAENITLRTRSEHVRIADDIVSGMQTIDGKRYLYVALDAPISYYDVALITPNECGRWERVAAIPSALASSECYVVFVYRLPWDEAFATCGWRNIDNHYMLDFAVTAKSDVGVAIDGETLQSVTRFDLPLFMVPRVQINPLWTDVDTQAPASAQGHASVDATGASLTDNTTVSLYVLVTTQVHHPMMLRSITSASTPPQTTPSSNLDGSHDADVVQDAMCTDPDSDCQNQWRAEYTAPASQGTMCPFDNLSGSYSLTFTLDCVDASQPDCATDMVTVSFSIDATNHCTVDIESSPDDPTPDPTPAPTPTDPEANPRRCGEFDSDNNRYYLDMGAGCPEQPSTVNSCFYSPSATVPAPVLVTPSAVKFIDGTQFMEISIRHAFELYDVALSFPNAAPGACAAWVPVSTSDDVDSLSSCHTDVTYRMPWADAFSLSGNNCGWVVQSQGADQQFSLDFAVTAKSEQGVARDGSAIRQASTFTMPLVVNMTTQVDVTSSDLTVLSPLAVSAAVTSAELVLEDASTLALTVTLVTSSDQPIDLHSISSGLLPPGVALVSPLDGEHDGDIRQGAACTDAAAKCTSTWRFSYTSGTTPGLLCDVGEVNGQYQIDFVARCIGDNPADCPVDNDNTATSVKFTLDATRACSATAAVGCPTSNPDCFNTDPDQPTPDPTPEPTLHASNPLQCGDYDSQLHMFYYDTGAGCPSSPSTLNTCFYETTPDRDETHPIVLRTYSAPFSEVKTVDGTEYIYLSLNRPDEYYDMTLLFPNAAPGECSMADWELVSSMRSVSDLSKCYSTFVYRMTWEDAYANCGWTASEDSNEIWHLHMMANVTRDTGVDAQGTDVVRTVTRWAVPLKVNFAPKYQGATSDFNVFSPLANMFSIVTSIAVGPDPSKAAPGSTFLSVQILNDVQHPHILHGIVAKEQPAGVTDVLNLNGSNDAVSLLTPACSDDPNQECASVWELVFSIPDSGGLCRNGAFDGTYNVGFNISCHASTNCSVDEPDNQAEVTFEIDVTSMCVAHIDGGCDIDGHCDVVAEHFEHASNPSRCGIFDAENERYFYDAGYGCPPIPTPYSACMSHVDAVAETESITLRTATTSAAPYSEIELDEHQHAWLYIALDIPAKFYDVDMVFPDAAESQCGPWLQASVERKVANLSDCYTTVVYRLPWESAQGAKCGWQSGDDGLTVDFAVSTKTDVGTSDSGTTIQRQQDFSFLLTATSPPRVDALPDAMQVTSSVSVNAAVTGAAITAVDDTTALLTLDLSTSTPAPFALASIKSDHMPNGVAIVTQLDGSNDDNVRQDERCNSRDSECANVWQFAYSIATEAGAFCDYAALSGDYEVSFEVVCSGDDQTDCPISPDNNTATVAFTLYATANCYMDIEAVPQVDPTPPPDPTPTPINPDANPLRCGEYDAENNRYYYSDTAVHCPDEPSTANTCYHDVSMDTSASMPTLRTHDGSPEPWSEVKTINGSLFVFISFDLPVQLYNQSFLFAEAASDRCNAWELVSNLFNSDDRSACYSTLTYRLPWTEAYSVDGVECGWQLTGTTFTLDFSVVTVEDVGQSRGGAPLHRTTQAFLPLTLDAPSHIVADTTSLEVASPAQVDAYVRTAGTVIEANTGTLSIDMFTRVVAPFELRSIVAVSQPGGVTIVTPLNGTNDGNIRVSPACAASGPSCEGEWSFSYSAPIDTNTLCATSALSGDYSVSFSVACLADQDDCPGDTATVSFTIDATAECWAQINEQCLDEDCDDGDDDDDGDGPTPTPSDPDANPLRCGEFDTSANRYYLNADTDEDCPISPSTTTACYYTPGEPGIVAVRSPSNSDEPYSIVKTVDGLQFIYIAIDSADMFYAIELEFPDAASGTCSTWELVSTTRHTEDLAACWSTRVYRMPFADSFAECGWTVKGDGADAVFSLDFDISMTTEEGVAPDGSTIRKVNALARPLTVHQPADSLVKVESTGVQTSAVVIAAVVEEDLVLQDAFTLALSVSLFTEVQPPYQLVQITSTQVPPGVTPISSLDGEHDDDIRQERPCSNSGNSCAATWRFSYSAATTPGVLCDVAGIDGDYAVSFKITCVDTHAECPIGPNADEVLVTFTLAGDCSADVEPAVPDDDGDEDGPDQDANPLRCGEYDAENKRYFLDSGSGCPDTPSTLNTCYYSTEPLTIGHTRLRTRSEVEVRYSEVRSVDGAQYVYVAVDIADMFYSPMLSFPDAADGECALSSWELVSEERSATDLSLCYTTRVYRALWEDAYAEDAGKCGWSKIPDGIDVRYTLNMLVKAQVDLADAPQLMDLPLPIEIVDPGAAEARISSIIINAPQPTLAHVAMAKLHVSNDDSALSLELVTQLAPSFELHSPQSMQVPGTAVLNSTLEGANDAGVRMTDACTDATEPCLSVWAISYRSESSGMFCDFSNFNGVYELEFTVGCVDEQAGCDVHAPLDKVTVQFTVDATSQCSVPIALGCLDEDVCPGEEPTENLLVCGAFDTENSRYYMRTGLYCPDGEPNTSNTCYYSTGPITFDGDLVVLRTSSGIPLGPVSDVLTVDGVSYLYLALDVSDELFARELVFPDAAPGKCTGWERVVEERHVDDLSSCYTTIVYRLPFDHAFGRDESACGWVFDDVTKTFTLNVALSAMRQEGENRGGDTLTRELTVSIPIEISDPHETMASASTTTVDAPLTVASYIGGLLAQIETDYTAVLGVEVHAATARPAYLEFVQVSELPSTALVRDVTSVLDPLSCPDTSPGDGCDTSWAFTFGTLTSGQPCDVAGLSGEYAVELRLKCFEGAPNCPVDPTSDTVHIRFTIEAARDCGVRVTHMCPRGRDGRICSGRGSCPAGAAVCVCESDIFSGPDCSLVDPDATPPTGGSIDRVTLNNNESGAATLVLAVTPFTDANGSVQRAFVAVRNAADHSDEVVQELSSASSSGVSVNLGREWTRNMRLNERYEVLYWASNTQGVNSTAATADLIVDHAVPLVVPGVEPTVELPLAHLPGTPANVYLHVQVTLSHDAGWSDEEAALAYTVPTSFNRGDISDPCVHGPDGLDCTPVSFVLGVYNSLSDESMSPLAAPLMVSVGLDSLINNVNELSVMSFTSATGWVSVKDACQAPVETFNGTTNSLHFKLCESSQVAIFQRLAAGPTIVSLVASDPDEGDNKYSNGDTITVQFGMPTNRPPVSTRARLDALFSFSQPLANDYEGVWESNSVLKITITSVGPRAPDFGVFTITVKESGNLRDALEETGASTAQSPPLTGSWGHHKPTDGAHSSGSSDNGLTVGLIVGAILLVLGAVGGFWWFKRGQRREDEAEYIAMSAWD